MPWRGPLEKGEFPTLGYVAADWIESTLPIPDGPKKGQPFDYFHVNSVDLERNGDLLVSARHTRAVYEISRRNPAEGARARPSLMDGRPQRHEGFVTDRPWESFAALWEMNDECHAHWLEGHERDLYAQAERLDII